MQSFNSTLFWHENIFKVDHLKQVYLTKLTDDARKTSAIRGQNRNTRHQDEIDLKTHRLIFHSHINFIWRRNENYWEPHCPISEYLSAKNDKR